MAQCQSVSIVSNPEKSDLLIWEDGDDKGLIILISDFPDLQKYADGVSMYGVF